MNYQYQYKNRYGNGRSNKSFVIKIARQFAVVLCMVLVVFMFKYVKTGTSEIVNSKIVDILNLDYTASLSNLAVDRFKGFNKYLDKFLGGVTTSEVFTIARYPLDGKITSGFGPRINPVTKASEIHNGIDISAKVGSDVKLIYSGVVEKVEDNKTMGLTLTINHNNGYKTIYGHLSEVEANVGEDISSGAVIAKSGNTGRSTGPHLHFEVHKGNVAVNPVELLKK